MRKGPSVSGSHTHSSPTPHILKGKVRLALPPCSVHTCSVHLWHCPVSLASSGLPLLGSALFPKDL